MKNTLLLAIVLLFTIPRLVISATTIEPDMPNANPAKYVSINIEIKELKESGLVLKEATTKLSKALNTISNDLNELSPEQLQLINELADKVDQIVEKLDTSFTSLPQTINRAKQPAEELLNNTLKTTREQTIDPIVSTIETWIIVTIIGLIVLALSLLIAVIIGFKSLSALGEKLKDIANGYRIIPVEQYAHNEDN